MKTNIPHRSLLACVGLIMALAAGSVQAQIVANFTDGNGTSSADQYNGIAGSGWSSAWSVSVNNASSTQTASVVSTNPLRGGGNYLSFTLNPVTGTAFNNVGLNRSWNTAVISPTAAPYRISFDYRVEDLTTFTGNDEYVSISAGSANNASPTGNSTFFVRAYGTNLNTGTGVKPGKTWLFYNGGKDGAGLNTGLFVSSGMALAAGTTYRFTIDMDPATLSYVATINNGTTSISSGVMGFRSTTANRSTLNFNAFLNTDTESLTYSLDSVGVGAIPEPSSYAALLGLAALGMTALRRRKRSA